MVICRKYPYLNMVTISTMGIRANLGGPHVPLQVQVRLLEPQLKLWRSQPMVQRYMWSP